MSRPIVRADHEQLSTIARTFDQQATAIEATLKQVSACVETLQGGDWKGQGATAFYAEMNNQVFPMLKRLNHALVEASRVTQQIGQIFQTAEDDASQVFRLVGGTQLVSHSLGGEVADLAKAGGRMTSDVDGGLNGWPPHLKNAIYINGVNTSGDDHRQTLTQIERVLGKRVMGVYNKTEGKISLNMTEMAQKLAAENLSLGGHLRWVMQPGEAIGRNLAILAPSLSGFVKDAYQVMGDITEASIGVRPSGNTNFAVDALAGQIKNHVFKPDEPLELYAHSQGAAITSAALWRLEREGFDLTQLKVVTFGGAGFRFPEGPSYEHYYRRTDVALKTLVDRVSDNVDGIDLPGRAGENLIEGHNVSLYIDEFAEYKVLHP